LKELLELTTAKQWKVREALKSCGWEKSKKSDIWIKVTQFSNTPDTTAKAVSF
jgi:hypothetical protein